MNLFSVFMDLSVLPKTSKMKFVPVLRLQIPSVIKSQILKRWQKHVLKRDEQFRRTPYNLQPL